MSDNDKDLKSIDEKKSNSIRGRLSHFFSQRKTDELDQKILLAHNMELEKKYANRTFIAICGYIAIVLSFVGFFMWFNKEDITEPMVITLITTIPSSMLLFGWVIRGIFKTPTYK